MGRTALMLVVGMAVAFGFISNSIRGSMNMITQSFTSYREYSGARELARVAVHHTLRRFDKNMGVESPVNFPIGSGHTPASFTADTSKQVDTLWMNTSGTYGDSTYRMRLKLLLSTKPFFSPNAAMSVRASINNLTVSGHPEIDGRNHTINAVNDTDTTGSGNQPGIGITNPADTSDVKAGVTSGLVLKGQPNYAIDNTTVDPAQFISEYWESADYKGTLSYTPPSPWGTVSPLSPKITFLDAGTDTSQSISITGGVTGCGILVVRGNVKIAGNFAFTGLVIFDGTTTIFDVTTSGTSSITGGLIVTGNAVNVSLKGTGSNAKMLYSSAALDASKNIGKLRYYKILDWWE